jgi:FXSXX-COOH protein
MDEVSPDIDTGLIDLTGVDLAEIDILGDSALARSLRRLISRTEHPGEAVAGFNDSI